MKDIKFRVWDMDKKDFIPTDVYGIMTTDFGAFGIMIKDWENYKEGEYFYNSTQSANQFTGRKDKNGVEIYEGDILKTKRFRNTTTDHVEEVVFNAGCFCTNANNDISVEISYHNESDIEVIGNIYQNPELLKV